MLTSQLAISILRLERERGYIGVLKRLRHDGHLIEKGGCEQLSNRLSLNEALTPEKSPCVWGRTVAVQAQPVIPSHANVDSFGSN